MRTSALWLFGVLLSAVCFCARADVTICDFQPLGGAGRIEIVRSADFEAVGGAYHRIDADFSSIFHVRLPRALPPGEYSLFVRQGPRGGKPGASVLLMALADDIEGMFLTSSRKGRWIGPLKFRTGRKTSILELRLSATVYLDAFAIAGGEEAFDQECEEPEKSTMIEQGQCLFLDWPGKELRPPWFTPEDAVRLRLRFGCEDDAKHSVRLNCAIVDFSRKQVGLQHWEVECERDRSREHLLNVDLPKAHGPYLLVLGAEVDGMRRRAIPELACARVAAPLEVDGSEWICAHLPPDEYYENCARMIGVSGVRAWDTAPIAVKGSFKDAGTGKFVFDDEVAGFRTSGLPVLGVLGSPSVAVRPKPGEDWSRYVRDVVGHYGSIEAWEVLGAPLGVFANRTEAATRAAESAELLSRTREDISAAAPHARVLGVCGPPLHLEHAAAFWSEAFSRGALRYCDVVSAHLYPGAAMGFIEEDVLLDAELFAVKTMMEQAGGPVRPVWNTESGFPPVESFYLGKSIRYGRLVSSKQMAKLNPVPMEYAVTHILRFALIHMWHESRWYIYRLNGSPGYDLSLCEQDGTPMPAAVAIAQAARILAGHKPDGRFDLGRCVTALRFRRSDDAAAVLWRVGVPGSGQPALLWPHGDLRVLDMLGNPVPKSDELILDARPVYVVGKADAVKAALGGAFPVVRGLRDEADVPGQTNLISPGRRDSPVVSASSTLKGHRFEPITDGRLDGYGSSRDSWASQTTEGEHYLNFRWTEPHNVNCATIAWSPAHMPDRYSLMWYDGKQWRPVFAGDAWREPAQLLESFFFEKVTTRMMRLVGVSRGGVGLRVAECKLFDVPQVTREPEDVAGEAARSYRPDDNGYIRDWLVCGPFATPGISKLEDPTRIAQGTWLSHDHLVDIRKGQVVPRSFAPSLEDAFVTVFPAMDGVQWKSGRVILRWLPVHSQRSYVDLVESMRVDLLFESRRELSQVAAYCACYVDMPRPFKGAVAIGSDDGFRLWIDGARVATKPVCRGAAADSDKYMIKLDKGQHLVLIKIINDTDDHGFFLRFLQQNGPLKDFTVRLAPGGYAPRNAASAETMLD